MDRPHVRKTHDLDSLTDVAMHVFALKGFDGASMDDVAAAAGITKAGIYHHVASKEALLARGLARALDALDAILAQTESLEGSATDRVRLVIRRVVERTLSLREELAVLFRVRGNSATEHRAIERRRAFDRTVTSLVESAQSEGGITGAIDARLIVRLAFGMSNSIVEWYRPSGERSAADVVEATEHLVFSGVGIR